MNTSISSPLPKTSEAELATLQDTLKRSVDSLYSAFAGRTLSENGPDACTYCCTSVETLERIAASPKDEIHFEDMESFLSAAKGYGAEADLVYLLPRIMQFISEGRDPKPAGLFAIFAHDLPEMLDRLTDQERAAIATFTTALTRWRMSLGSQTRCDYSLIDVLEMLATGGFETTPMLDALAHPPRTIEAASALVDLINHDSHFCRGNYFYEVPDDKAAAIATSMRRALSSTRVTELLEVVALSEDDNERAEKASLAHLIAEGMRNDQPR